jgi:chain length determinant protein EpsF
MNTTQIISILIARKWILIWVFALTVITTTVISFILAKTYTATTSLVISSKGVDPVSGLMLPPTMMTSYLATQVDIIQSRNVALKVVDKLNIVNSATAKAQFIEATKGEGDIRDWYADKFLKNLTVQPSRESSVIDVSYQGTDPKFSAALANEFAAAYINTNLQLKIEPAKRAALWFDQEIKGLRQNVEVAQERLSVYQKEHGITSQDDRLDIETARLNELSNQLVAAQAQTYDSNSRYGQLKKGVEGASPEVLANPLIQGLKSQLTQAENKLKDISQHLGSNHPSYQAAQAEVSHLRNTIAAEISKTSSSVGQTARVSQQKEAEIKTALAVQKAHVLKFKTERDEMAVLMREAESAQRIYDNALQRFGQTNMESKSVQTDVAILNPAIAPIKHSSPRITINILLSIVLGSLLAVGVALIAEMLDRKIRTTEDLLKLIELPVLADINKSAKKPMTLLNRLRKVLQRNKQDIRMPSDLKLIVK